MSDPKNIPLSEASPSMTDLDGLIHDLLATDNIALMDDAAAAYFKPAGEGE